MTDFRPPWERPLDALVGIPICIDPELPAGTVALDLDPEEPRHITGIRTADHHTMKLTDEQHEQIRDHYRAMDERAGRALVDFQRLVNRLGSDPSPEPAA